MKNEESPEQPQDTGADSHQPDELEEVLTQASDLAAELASQVGKEGETPVPSHKAPGAPGNVDDELNEIDHLVATASEQIDPSAREAGAPAPTTNSASQLEVPDFMAEFTAAQEPADEGTAPAPKPDAHPQDQAGDHAAAAPSQPLHPKPGVISTGPIGVVGTPDATKPGSAAPPQAQTLSDPKEPTQAVDDPKAVHGVLAGLQPRALTIGSAVVSLLERMDRPFTWLGGPVRRIVGWLAIATLGTALIVFFLSFW